MNDDFRPMIAVTFDDGHRSLSETAYPIMRAAGIVGTSYVSTALIGGDHMTLAEHAALRGWEIGVHSHRHDHMRPMTDADQWAEIMIPVQHLAGLTGRQPASFACPYGDCDNRLIDKVRMVHHSHVCAGGPAFGLNTLSGWSRYHINRFVPIVTTPVAAIMDSIDGLSATQMLALCFHRVDESGEAYSYSPYDFIDVIDHIARSGFRAVTITEGARQMDYMLNETRGYADAGWMEAAQ